VLAPGASTKKAAAAAAKALGAGALRASGWAWPDAAAYEAEVALQQRFLVDTGLSSGARRACAACSVLGGVHLTMCDTW